MNDDEDILSGLDFDISNPLLAAIELDDQGLPVGAWSFPLWGSVLEASAAILFSDQNTENEQSCWFSIGDHRALDDETARSLLGDDAEVSDSTYAASLSLEMYDLSDSDPEDSFITIALNIASPQKAVVFTTAVMWQGSDDTKEPDLPGFFSVVVTQSGRRYAIVNVEGNGFGESAFDVDDLESYPDFLPDTPHNIWRVRSLTHIAGVAMGNSIKDTISAIDGVGNYIIEETASTLAEFRALAPSLEERQGKALKNAIMASRLAAVEAMNILIPSAMAVSGEPGEQVSELIDRWDTEIPGGVNYSEFLQSAFNNEQLAILPQQLGTHFLRRAAQATLSVDIDKVRSDQFLPSGAPAELVSTVKKLTPAGHVTAMWSISPYLRYRSLERIKMELGADNFKRFKSSLAEFGINVEG